MVAKACSRILVVLFSFYDQMLIYMSYHYEIYRNGSI